MDRTKIISLILCNSELFTKVELQNYSNDQLYETLRALFLTIRIKIAKTNENIDLINSGGAEKSNLKMDLNK